MRSLLLIYAIIAAFAIPVAASAQDGTRPLDRIYGPARAGDAQPARRSMTPSPAARGETAPRSYDPGSRPLDRIYGSGSSGRSAAGRGGGVGGGSSLGRPGGGSSLGAGPSGPSTGATTRKPAGPAYRGGTVGTRPRFSNSPTLSAPRR